MVLYKQQYGSSAPTTICAGARPSGRFVVRDFLRRGFSVTSRVCATRKRRKRRAPAARIDDAKPTLCNTRLSGDFRLIPSLWLLQGFLNHHAGYGLSLRRPASLRHYTGLLDVEEAFCELKSYLEVRPVHHWRLTLLRFCRQGVEW